MLTPQRLIEAAQITPASLGINAIGDFPDASPEEIETIEGYRLLQKIEKEILPGALAEVRVRLFAAAEVGFAEGVTALAQTGADFLSLFDLAVVSYARSEINKQQDSNAKEYDADSDQDRIQGNQRLAKLIEAVGKGALSMGVVNPTPIAAIMTIEVGERCDSNEFGGCYGHGC